MYDLPTAETIPPCWNREPRAEGEWVHTRRERARFGPPQGDGGQRITGWRPVLRWRWSPFVDRCAVHDGQGIGPNGENYPEAHGWMPWCRLCTWFPSKETSP